MAAAIIGAFLASGIYLLLNGHPVAGGWCIAAAILHAALTPEKS